MDALDKECPALRRKLARLYEDKLAGEVSRETYNVLVQRFEDQLAEVERGRTSLSATESRCRFDAERVFELGVSASDRFKQGDSDIRREILQLVLLNCIYDGHCLIIETLA